MDMTIQNCGNPQDTVRFGTSSTPTPTRTNRQTSALTDSMPTRPPPGSRKPILSCLLSLSWLLVSLFVCILFHLLRAGWLAPEGGIAQCITSIASRGYLGRYHEEKHHSARALSQPHLPGHLCPLSLPARTHNTQPHTHTERERERQVQQQQQRPPPPPP